MTETVSPVLDERFRAAAAAEGLLDVAYDVLTDTPIGALLVGVTDHGVCRISFDPDPERELETLARLHGSRVLRASAPVERVRKELDEYFAGKRHHFDVEPDVRFLPAYNQRVLAQLARVEYGTTTTYGARGEVRQPPAARAVGTVMNRNPVPIVLACHRVIGANGSLTGYAGGLERKVQLRSSKERSSDALRAAADRRLRARPAAARVERRRAHWAAGARRGDAGPACRVLRRATAESSNFHSIWPERNSSAAPGSRSLEIPYGETRTYAEQARRLGLAHGARAVGSANARNPLPIVIPCHRLVGSTGKLTGYAGGLDRKERLLRLEGALL